MRVRVRVQTTAAWGCLAHNIGRYDVEAPLHAAAALNRAPALDHRLLACRFKRGRLRRRRMQSRQCCRLMPRCVYVCDAERNGVGIGVCARAL